MKSQVRFLGLDDAPFRKGDAHVPIVGVVTRGASYVEGVLSTRAAVDGDDATDAVLGLLEGSKFRPLLRAVFLNGIFVGGFNLVDPQRLHDALEIPIMALVRSQPRQAKVEAAMRGHVADGAQRWGRVRSFAPLPLPGLGLWGTVRGASEDEAVAIIRSATVRGRLPEPLRLAHIVASGFVRGESRGRA